MKYFLKIYNSRFSNLAYGIVYSVSFILSVSNLTIAQTRGISTSEGYQFVLIGDQHVVSKGSKYKEINSIINSLKPQPNFICIAGDHIWGWKEDTTMLKRQWLQWFSQNQDLIKHKIFHSTANHPVVGPLSAKLYAELFPQIPNNGPDNGKKLNYFVRENDFLLVVVNTAWNSSVTETGKMGGQSVNTEWLEKVLSENKDAKYKIVMGHHPVFIVNGFHKDLFVKKNSGKKMWELFKAYGVRAYLSAHIIGYDVQVHEGIIQIVSGGAGYPFFFGKDDTEYNHFVQLALNKQNFSCQSIDKEGNLKEWLNWPIKAVNSKAWKEVKNKKDIPKQDEVINKELKSNSVAYFRFRASINHGNEKMLLSSTDDNYWIGIKNQQICIRTEPITSQIDGGEIDSMIWRGPEITARDLDIQIAIHSGMGPGGLLYRTSDNEPWSSLNTSSWHSPLVNGWPEHWEIGKGVKINTLVSTENFSYNLE